MRTTLLALAALLVPATAIAQPALTAPAPAPLASVPQPLPARDQPRMLDSNTALALSLGGTIAGWGALYVGAESDDSDTATLLGIAGTAGIMFGPSFGHWYQGDIWTRGLATRLAGTVAFGIGLSTFDLCIDSESCDDGDDTLTGAMLLGGMALFAVGTVDDVVSAPIAAQRRNREAQQAFQFSIAPRVTSKEAGLTLVGRF